MRQRKSASMRVMMYVGVVDGEGNDVNEGEFESEGNDVA